MEYTHTHTHTYSAAHTFQNSKRVQQQPPPPLTHSPASQAHFISPGLTYCGLCEKVWMGRYWESVRAHEVMCNCTAQNKSIEWEEINMPASSSLCSPPLSAFCAHIRRIRSAEKNLQLTKNFMVFFNGILFFGGIGWFHSWFWVRKCGGLWVDGRAGGEHILVEKGLQQTQSPKGVTR